MNSFLLNISYSDVKALQNVVLFHDIKQKHWKMDSVNVITQDQWT